MVATNGADCRIARCSYRPERAATPPTAAWLLSEQSGHQGGGHSTAAVLRVGVAGVTAGPGVGGSCPRIWGCRGAWFRVVWTVCAERYVTDWGPSAAGVSNV